MKKLSNLDDELLDLDEESEEGYDSYEDDYDDDYEEQNGVGALESKLSARHTIIINQKGYGFRTLCRASFR